MRQCVKIYRPSLAFATDHTRVKMMAQNLNDRRPGSNQGITFPRTRLQITEIEQTTTEDNGKENATK